MHINVSITKKNVFTVITLIMGLVFLCKGIHSNYKYQHIVSLENLSEQGYHEGTYVAGNIDTYIGLKIINLGNGKFSGVSETLITFEKDYEFYTIPIAPNSYIRIMVSDKSTLDKLENFVNGKGEGIYFEGEIIKAPLELPYQWYAEIDGVEPEDVISSFVIKETNLAEKNEMIYSGIAFLILAILLFYDGGGMKSFITTVK